MLEQDRRPAEWNRRIGNARERQVDEVLKYRVRVSAAEYLQKKFNHPNVAFDCVPQNAHVELLTERSCWKEDPGRHTDPLGKAGELQLKQKPGGFQIRGGRTKDPMHCERVGHLTGGKGRRRPNGTACPRKPRSVACRENALGGNDERKYQVR